MPPESSKSPVSGAQWREAMGQVPQPGVMGKDPPVGGDAGSSPASGPPRLGRPPGSKDKKKRLPQAPPGYKTVPKTPERAPDSIDRQLADSWEGHALVLARSQSTMGEIVASLTEAYGLSIEEASRRVEAIKMSLLVAAHSGRAFLRRRIFDAATGKLWISRDERSLLMALGRQHLGHTVTGTDMKVRRIVESAERRALGVAQTFDETPDPQSRKTEDGEDTI